jgi:hypothetical protein
VAAKLSEIRWGLCVPSTCTAGEVGKLLEKKIRDVISSDGVMIEVELPSNMCQTVQQNFFDLGFLISV